MQNCHLAGKTLIERRVHVPPVRARVALIKLFLAQGRFVKQSVVLEHSESVMNLSLDYFF